MRGLYRRGDIWWLRYADADGRLHRESTGAKDRQRAVRALEKRRTDVFEGKFFDRRQSSRVCFGELLRKYLRWSKGAKAPKSHLRDRGLAKQLLEHFGDQAAAKITAARIEVYRETRNRRAEKAWTT